MMILENVEALVQVLEERLKCQPSLFLTIDGPCGSGKTCLAQALQEKFGGALFHMDDYLLPFSLRTPERMSQPGGHVHHERIQEELFAPLEQRQQVLVRPYRCHLQDFAPTIPTEYHPFHTLEGSFSHHPTLAVEGQLRLYLTCPKEVQLSRLRNREGEEKLVAFINQWIPKEEVYFSTFAIEEHCHLYLDTGTLFP